MQLATIIDVLQELAPPALAEDWDNTGLLLGDPVRNVDRALTCLTLTGDVAAEAVAAGVQLVVTHHPLLFKPVQTLTAATPEGRTVLTLLQHGIAVYSPHTSWDNAPLGINQQLAELFELDDIRPLRPRESSLGCKIIVYVPESARAAVQECSGRPGLEASGTTHAAVSLRREPGRSWGTLRRIRRWAFPVGLKKHGSAAGSSLPGKSRRRCPGGDPQGPSL